MTAPAGPMDILLGHSPDPDDAFMFYGLAKGFVDAAAYRFTHILQDIETLNRRALAGELHISAVSIHAYAHLQDKYALLACGASMGDGYGPMVVARPGLTLGRGEAPQDRRARHADQRLPRPAPGHRRLRLRRAAL